MTTSLPRKATKPGKPKLPRARKPRAKGAPSSNSKTIPGTLGGAQVVEVLLEDVLLEDTTFQYRLEPAVKDILSSLRVQGQREPIDLLGSKP
ncbi:MAG TPA: hypothetical protein VMM35_04295, partial [Longimicrobiales bacterium]|nr:hypothetical protein [Longimicrobiales bacterium]